MGGTEGHFWEKNGFWGNAERALGETKDFGKINDFLGKQIGQ